MVIPVMTQHYIMLQRNLIYTAVTRCLTGAVITVFLSRIITTVAVHYIIKNRYLMQETFARTR